MNRFSVGLLRFSGRALRIASVPFLLIGWIATPILNGSRWCDRIADEKAPPEWKPRLWDRTGGRTANEPRD